MPTLAESYPVAAPKPSSKPKLFVHETDLTVTPEKTTKVVNEGKTKNRKKHCDAKKKVMFKENKVKDMFLEPCPLSNPSLHTTNLLTREIEENRNRNFDVAKALQEIQLSESVQNTIGEEVTTVLNYKPTDRKYKNLTSLNVEADDVIIPKTRTLYKEKNKDCSLKPDIKDLYFPEDFVTEKGKTDFDVNIPDEGKEECCENKYSFLFDLYECQEYLPHQNFSI
ncbi:uncharacterized protein LOC130636553 [Hydractinia symbiolongicarpus]|uniref:uncharacterized protein LOC130636553 n=1 Tax=Hydractinia symbiolongicarpus TaxID=13093 RepID=UPI00254BC804|nr:uncharacterized protein LOC130636553 [Hydractinia symbiolongicarpus]